MYNVYCILIYKLDFRVLRTTKVYKFLKFYVQRYSKFAPNLSDATKPLRDLLKEDIEFVWDEQTEAALKKIK